MESEANISGEDVTVLEFFSLINILSVDASNELINIPDEIFLEYTFTSAAEIIAQSIQSALGGICLPTAIKDGHGGVINLSNFVAVKANNRDASFSVKVNRSVGRLPVDVLLNSGTHLGFDLTHEKRLGGRLLCVGVLSPPLL